MIVILFWRLGLAYLYYPIIFGLAIWLTVKDVHWGYGVLLLIFVLLTDPLFRILYRRFRGIFKR